VTESSEAASRKADLAARREQLDLLSRALDREAHILMREPEVLPSHLHNMLFLDEGEEGPGRPPADAGPRRPSGATVAAPDEPSAGWGGRSALVRVLLSTEPE
jgi:hypothetical protein